MKTKELIRQLQENDPSGEEHCTVDGIDIWFVDRLPGYYDGNCEQLIRDPEKKGYNIVGAKIKRRSDKIMLRTLSIEDAIWNDPELPLDVSEVSNYDGCDYKEKYDELRKKIKEYK